MKNKNEEKQSFGEKFKFWMRKAWRWVKAFVATPFKADGLPRNPPPFTPRPPGRNPGRSQR